MAEPRDRSGQQEEAQFFLEEREIGVGGDEGRVAQESERRSKAIGVGQLVLGFEFGGQARLLEINRNYLNRELGDIFNSFASYAGPATIPNDVVNLAPVDNTEKQPISASMGKLDEAGDLLSARFISEQCDQRAGVEHSPFHW